MNHFTLLNLPPTFNLDLSALEKAYFAQQRLYHPDRFVKKSASERQQALLRSVEINSAYETLKKPLARAQYLLHLQGIAVGTENDSVKPSPALLMETMQWREAIDEAATPEVLQKLHDALTAMHTNIIDAIAKAYASMRWQDMAEQTLRLGYVIKAQEAVTRQKNVWKNKIQGEG